MIQDQVESTLIHHLPEAIIRHAIVPYLDRAFIIVCANTFNDSLHIKSFLDEIEPFADALCILDDESTDDTVDRITDEYDQRPLCIRFSAESDSTIMNVNDLTEQAKRLALDHNLPFDSTFMCVLQVSEKITCANVKQLKELLVERNDCHYQIRRTVKRYRHWERQVEYINIGLARLSLPFKASYSSYFPNIESFAANIRTVDQIQIHD